MPMWAVWLLAAGVVLRLTLVVTADTIGAPVRAAWHGRFPKHSDLGGFITCPWCVSFWIAIPVVLAAGLFGTTAWFWGPAMVLSLSATTGFLAGLAGALSD